MKNFLILLSILVVIPLFAQIHYSFGNYEVTITGCPKYKIENKTVDSKNYLQITTDANDNVIDLSQGINKIFPNPFKPFSSSKDEITIEFSLNKKAKTEISVYNLKGEKVKTLLNTKLEKGEHSIMWNGKNDSGKNCGKWFLSL